MPSQPNREGHIRATCAWIAKRRTMFPLYNLNPASSISEMMRTLEAEADRKTAAEVAWHYQHREMPPGQLYVLA